MTPVRVAVVDDSSFIRLAIERMLEEDERMVVVGTASSGEELIANLDEWRPDVITLDLSMPGMGGLRTLDHIMRTRPTPVIVLSGRSRQDAPLAIEALHRGAVDFIDKRRYSLVDFDALRDVLVHRILELGGAPAGSAAARAPRQPARPARGATPERYELLVIGASTGGPVAIQELLAAVGERLPVPAVVAQHMPPGFTAAFAQRLNGRLPLAVREASDGELLAADTVHIAPAGCHAAIERRAGRLRLRVAEDAERSFHHLPSVDALFASAASAAGRAVVGVLLTGMGRDGARGMAAIAAAGGHTIAQDEASSVVWGMPRAAVEMAAARETLALARIAPRLRELLPNPG